MKYVVSDQLIKIALERYRRPVNSESYYDAMKAALEAVLEHIGRQESHIGTERPLKEPVSAENAQAGDGWIEWKGGDCPVDSEVNIEVRYSGACSYPHWIPQGSKAKEFTWSHGWGLSDITAYRIVQEPKED